MINTAAISANNVRMAPSHFLQISACTHRECTLETSTNLGRTRKTTMITESNKPCGEYNKMICILTAELGLLVSPCAQTMHTHRRRFLERDNFLCTRILFREIQRLELHCSAFNFMSIFANTVCSLRNSSLIIETPH